jgi:hypothetical protein
LFAQAPKKGSKDYDEDDKAFLQKKKVRIHGMGCGTADAMPADADARFFPLLQRGVLRSLLGGQLICLDPFGGCRRRRLP